MKNEKQIIEEIDSIQSDAQRWLEKRVSKNEVYSKLCVSLSLVHLLLGELFKYAPNDMPKMLSLPTCIRGLELSGEFHEEILRILEFRKVLKKEESPGET